MVMIVRLVQVNDSLSGTQLCLSFAPLEVAAGCLHLASVLLGTAQQFPCSKQTRWWDAIGVQLSAIEEVGHALCDAAEGREQQIAQQLT